MNQNSTLLKGINVVSISVPDLEKAREFYSETLGLGAPVYNLPESGWIEFSSGSDSGNISVTLAEDGWVPSQSTTIVFNVPDCNEAVNKLRRRGVRCDDATTFPGFVTFASFYDPFGNRLQICSPAASN